MSPEDWKTYWRTAALTPFQILVIEVMEEPAPDWQTVKIDAACDYWEAQMMGIRL